MTTTKILTTAIKSAKLFTDPDAARIAAVELIDRGLKATVVKTGGGGYIVYVDDDTPRWLK